MTSSPTMTPSHDQSAYGGAGWQPRGRSTRAEIGALWAPCGLASEWAPLRAVLLHRPGTELDASSDPDTINILAPLDLARAQEQHDTLARIMAQGIRTLGQAKER